MTKKQMFSFIDSPDRIFMTVISLVGWFCVGIQLIAIDTWNDPWIYGLLLIFFLICEYYPMPVWRGFSSISFPVVFVIYFIYGLPIAVFSYALVMFLISIIKRRPLRIIFFNPSQLLLSLYIGAVISDYIMTSWISLSNTVFSQIVELALMSIIFYIVNNLIVDIVLLLRPQHYPYKVWKQKFLSELNSLGISFVYACLFIILGSQNRGQIDVFTFFFFFSPLVGLALLSSSIVRIRKERTRLKALFSLTSNLNKMLPDHNWLDVLKTSFHELIDVEAMILWTNENGKWKMSSHKGKVSTKPLTMEMVEQLQTLKVPLVITDRKYESLLTDIYFEQKQRSFVYAPLVIDQETVGVFAIARSRTKAFGHEEIQAIATLSNQLAVILKTRLLIEEKEKRSIVEERNRIARDIHDGVAQTIAGALMKLETAQRKWEKSPEETKILVIDSMDKLRGSLKQIRQSIYALRPYITERVGLQSAIKQRITVFEKETGLSFTYEERGENLSLSSMVEKILYDTFQESVQNIIKHAHATKVEILLSYQKEHILLRVKDNGVGFSLVEAMMKAQKEPHFGILQMNDAAERIGASLQIDSKPEQGTEISMMVPRMGIEEGFEYDQANVSG
ncbi:histidine kinase [Bacillus pinisoli]|uniref:histidine kinase n=1 Tax=Bacillus pinisoli TaxID=2901866 RepID=UPI001FF49CF4